MVSVAQNEKLWCSFSYQLEMKTDRFIVLWKELEFFKISKADHQAILKKYMDGDYTFVEESLIELIESSEMKTGSDSYMVLKYDQLLALLPTRRITRIYKSKRR